MILSCFSDGGNQEKPLSLSLLLPSLVHLACSRRLRSKMVQNTEKESADNQVRLSRPSTRFRAHLLPPSQLPTPRDYLSSLPVETLTAIFKLAYTGSSPSTGPISRALLPFDREQRFRRLEVKSMERLRALANIVENGGTGQWVKELKMEKVDVPSPAFTERQLKSFFSSLPHLSRLDLGEGCQSTQRLVLSNSITRAGLREMVKLSLADPDEKNPFEPSLFRLIPSYPLLSSLSVASRKKWQELTRVKISKKQVEKLSNIKELSLKSEGADHPLLVERLDKACPSLEAVVLDTADSHQPDYLGVLPLLPATLRRLELRTKAFYDGFAHPCEAHLLPRTSLSSLYLGEGTFSHSLFPILRQLPHLTSLGFGKGAIVPVPELVALVDSATPLLNLKTLVLDIVKGQRGWRVFEDGKGQLHPDAHPGSHLGPGWESPRFSVAFGTKAVKDALRTIKAKGVKVEGTTVEALEIDLDWFVELSACAEVVAFETGDFDELRELMGNEYVDDMLHQIDEEMGFYDDFAFFDGEYDDYEGEYGCG
jgi:hypothetical protein